MAYHHATAYEKGDSCQLVACADIVRENAEAFADKFDLDEAGIFEDYEAMLADLEPDMISSCVPPASTLISRLIASRAPVSRRFVAKSRWPTRAGTPDE